MLYFSWINKKDIAAEIFKPQSFEAESIAKYPERSGRFRDNKA